MSALLATLLAALSALLVLAFARLAARLGPAWAPAYRGATWIVAAALLTLALLVARAFSVDPLGRLAAALGLAREGHAGAVVALALTLALLVALVTLLDLALGLRRAHASRAPAGALSLLLGVAPDGSALEGARRPLRWGLTGLLAASLASLALRSPGTLSDPLPWALAATWLTALLAALTRPAAPPAPVSTVAAAASADDPHPAFHAALGSPPLVEREPAVEAGAHRYSDDVLQAFADGPGPHLVAAAAPPGAGKRAAAEALSERMAARGLTTFWITSSTADLEAALSEHFPRLGLVVVDATGPLLGESLAALRYGLHRLFARIGRRPEVLVLGTSLSVVTVARVIGAAEPQVVAPRGPLPTRPIQRYLLAGPPPPELVPPADTSILTLDRPAPLARYPAARALAHEYLVPAPGPRGRRMAEDRARSLVRGRTPRLLVTLPGDRHAAERRDQLARFHLRAALAEAPQDLLRLREVFSPSLVDAELAALSRSGLVSHISAWQPAPTGIVPLARVAARLPSGHADAPETLTIVEPRSGHQRAVPKLSADFEHYDGALVAGPHAARYEVRLSTDGAQIRRVLVPTEVLAATPLRSLSLRPLDPARKTRLRFRGERELEVWEAPSELLVTHRGVRQFSVGAEAQSPRGAEARTLRGAEARALTRLLPAPLALPPLRTSARLLFLDASRPALHAITHAVREALPCFFDNAADVGVTYTTPESDPLARAALVFFDAHPDGLGAVADLRDEDLEALLLAASDLLDCDCAAHCAACCESTSCTEPEVALDRHEAARVLSQILVARPIALGPRGAAALLRRTG